MEAREKEAYRDRTGTRGDDLASTGEMRIGMEKARKLVMNLYDRCRNVAL